MVTATFGSGGRGGRGGGHDRGRGTSRVQGRGDQQPGKTYSWADIANNPCVHHLDTNGGSSHTNAKCRFNDDIKRDDTASYKAKRKKGKKNPEKDKETKEDSDMEEVDASNPKPEGKKKILPRKTLMSPSSDLNQQRSKRQCYMTSMQQFRLSPNSWTGRNWQSHLTTLIILLSCTGEENTP